MDKKIQVGSRSGSYGTRLSTDTPTKATNKRKESLPLDAPNSEIQSNSKKFRLIAENAAQKITSPRPKANGPSRSKSTINSYMLENFRYRSLEGIANLLPRDAPTSAEILAIAESAFDSGIPYFLSKQRSSNPPLYRDSSTIFYHLFYESEHFYSEGTPEHKVWRAHVEDQDLLLFTGENVEPVSMGGVYKMLSDGLDIPAIELLLTAANPRYASSLTENKVLISFLYKINYLPKSLMPPHTDILQTLSKDDIDTARLTIAVTLASIDRSPMLLGLLDEGFPVNQKDKTTGFVPLTTAIVNNARANVDLLIQRGADLIVDHKYLADDDVLTDENRDLVMWSRQEVAKKS